MRRPPRGVPKSKFASGNWYDVWLPTLAPSEATRKMGLSAKTGADWLRFTRRYRAEMKRPEAARTLDLLAALSRSTDFSVGCYCEDEARCHRSLLRSLLVAARRLVDERVLVLLGQDETLARIADQMVEPNE